MQHLARWQSDDREDEPVISKTVLMSLFVVKVLTLLCRGFKEDGEMPSCNNAEVVDWWLFQDNRTVTRGIGTCSPNEEELIFINKL